MNKNTTTAPGSIIRGSGTAFPGLSFSNEDVCRWHGRKDAAWLRQKFGVERRHSHFDYRNDRLVLDKDDNDLAVEACERALADAELAPREIDALLFVSSTPAHVLAPDGACVVHHRLGLSADAGASMQVAGCAGMLNVLMLGAAMIRARQAHRVLVCASCSLSTYLRRDLVAEVWIQASIFGDAAAAFVLAADDERPDAGFSTFYLGANHKKDVAVKRFGGSKHQPTKDNIDDLVRDHFVFDYQRVPTNLRETFTHLYRRALPEQPPRGMPEWVLFNMSNAQVQRGWAESMGLPEERFVFNMDRFGNCGAASLGLVLHDWRRSGRVRSGDRALLMAVGTGLQYGSVFYSCP